MRLAVPEGIFAGSRDAVEERGGIDVETALGVQDGARSRLGQRAGVEAGGRADVGVRRIAAGMGDAVLVGSPRARAAQASVESVTVSPGPPLPVAVYFE